MWLNNTEYFNIRREGFAKRRELGKQLYLTLRSKFSIPYEANTLKLAKDL